MSTGACLRINEKGGEPNQNHHALSIRGVGEPLLSGDEEDDVSGCRCTVENGPASEHDGGIRQPKARLVVADLASFED